MVDILAAVPLSVGGIIALLLNALVAFIALVIADKIIAHSINVKKLFIIALVALFLTPIVGAVVLELIALPVLVSAYILPLLVWIILGEVLLSSDMGTKAKVAVIGFVVYIVLSIFLTPYLFSVLSF